MANTDPSTDEPKPDLDGRDPLIVFDGVCVLCSGFARTIVRLDHEKRFRFATAQSPLGEALYRRHGLRTDVYETNLVIVESVAYIKMDSFIAVMSELGWPWRATKMLGLLPRPIRDWIYDRVAQNRYALFGRKESCEIPSSELRERIIG